MRELLLLAIVAALCPISFLKPRLGLYAYTWFALMRPDYLAWAEGDYPFSLVLAICTLAGGFGYVVRAGRWLQNPFSFFLLVLQVPVGLSVMFAVSPQLALAPYNIYLRVILMAMLIPLMIEELRHFREFFLIVAFSIGLLGAKWGIGGILRGGVQYQSGYGGFLADNNCVALAFAMVIPLCWYARNLVTARWAKAMYLTMVFGSMAGVVWTHSRGGALSAVAVLLLISIRTKYKLPVLVGFALLAAPAVYLVRESYLDRLATIEDYDTEDSAMNRIAYGKAALEMWSDHPILGVGFGSTNFQALLPDYLGREDHHVAHDTYVQTLADSGIFAFLLYVYLLFWSIWWLGRSASRMRRLRPELLAYPHGLQGAMVAFAVGSTFLSRVAFDFYYILLMMTAAWYLIEKQLLREGNMPAQQALPTVRPFARPQPVPAGVTFAR